MEKEQAQAFQAYSDAAAVLSQRRTAAATQLAEQISASMQGLGMPGGRFAITCKPLARPSPAGLEGVEFLVSAQSKPNRYSGWPKANYRASVSPFSAAAAAPASHRR
ncbi:MAG: hypothetical protein R3F37_18765 [Candidatus Competibacteraceae bacterium]